MTAVSIGFAPSFEFAMLDFIQAHMRSGANDFLMPWISRLGDGGVVWIILTAVLCLCPKTRMTGLALAIALAVEFVCCNLILKWLST